jgi:hypothetical protein
MRTSSANNRSAGWPRSVATRVRSSGRGFVQPRRCAFENIESGTESVDFHHATEIHESHDFCRMGVCTVRGGALRTFHLLGVGPSCRIRRHPSAGSHAVLERARSDHIATHSRGAVMTTARAKPAVYALR